MHRWERMVPAREFRLLHVEGVCLLACKDFRENNVHRKSHTRFNSLLGFEGFSLNIIYTCFALVLLCCKATCSTLTHNMQGIKTDNKTRESKTGSTDSVSGGKSSFTEYYCNEYFHYMLFLCLLPLTLPYIFTCILRIIP